MPTSDIGEIGRRVGDNVKRLRLAHELSLRDLSAKLAGCGRPILASGLMKIEHGQRRVDVDDLAALAEALGVLPGRLLTDEREAVLTAEQYRLHRGPIDRAEREVASVAIKGVPPTAVLDYLARALTIEATQSGKRPELGDG